MNKIVTRTIGGAINLASIVSPKFAAKKGFQLFCTPFNPKLRPEQQSFMESAEKLSFKGEGIPEIQLYKWGTGSKSVLLVHGWSSHTFRWIKYIIALQKLDYTIYAFDAPGHGLSKGKILNIPLYERVFSEFSKQYGSMDYYIGHSMGAFTILYGFFRNKSIDAKALVLLAAPGEAQDFVDMYQEMLRLSDRSLKLIMDYFIATYDLPINYFKSATFAKEIRTPSLIVHDKDDKDAPFHYGENLSKIMENSESYFTEGLGHKLKSPELVNKVVEYLEAH